VERAQLRSHGRGKKRELHNRSLRRGKKGVELLLGKGKEENKKIYRKGKRRGQRRLVKGGCPAFGGGELSGSKEEYKK